MLPLLLFISCSSSLKQQWYDFTAYYNTFFNASHYFNEGVREERGARPPVNPEQYLRIYPAPSGAGTGHFERTIETGADLLRRHPRSGYVDRTVELIGKSYFYRGEYFAATEKFRELQASAAQSTLRQRAFNWEMRAYLELGLHAEAIRMLEAELDPEKPWEPSLRAEAQLLLAQHLVERGDTEQAAGILSTALSDLEDRQLKSKGYFLLGQLLEQSGRYDPSWHAYREVQQHRPDFELDYYSRKKEADLIRKVGNHEMAYQLLRSMERDDKYSDRRPELRYELARTEQMRGNYDEALYLYRSVLAYPYQFPEGRTLARAYYSMAEMYQESFSNLELAAAYYDSASMQQADPAYLPAGWDADERAASFGEYVRITGEISRLDSLLYLGMLTPGEFEIELARIERQLEEEERQRIQMQFRETANWMAPGYPEEEELLAEEHAGSDGFLNINNDSRMEEAAARFRSIWGDRPLADNWRRMEIVSGTGRVFSEREPAAADPSEQDRDRPPEPQSQPALNLDEIPFTESRQDSVKREIVLLKYRLGTVFLLNLNMPDSANIYFDQVVTSARAPELRPGAIYALSEIARQHGDIPEAEAWMRTLLEEYPGSPTAIRIAGQSGLSEFPGETGEELSSAERARQILLEHDDPFEQALALHSLAMTVREPDDAAGILYEAALSYIRAGRQMDGFDQRLQEWELQRENWNLLREEYFALQDSAISKLEEDLDEEERSYWLDVSETTLPEPDFNDYFPFEGAAWDSARSVLRHIDSLQAPSGLQNRAGLLIRELRPPDSR